MAILQDEPATRPIGTVVLMHGFSRSPEDLGGLAGGCTAMGARTLRPGLGSLWWPTSSNNPAHLSRVGARLASLLAPGPVVVVGHSAGASAGAWIAAELLAWGLPVSELVMVDGVEGPAGLIRRSWPRLRDVSVRAVCAPASRCNRQGALAEWLARQPGSPRVVTLPGMGHGDIEGPTRRLYRFACGDDATQPAGDRLRALVMEWVREGLGRTAGPTRDR